MGIKRPVKIKKEKADIPIAIAAEGEAGDFLILYCHICNKKLLHAPKFGKGVYKCGTCGIEYYPEKESVKHGTGIETWDGVVSPDGSIDNIPRVAYTPEPITNRRKGPQLKGGFKAMEEGSNTLHFTSYITSEKQDREEEEEEEYEDES